MDGEEKLELKDVRNALNEKKYWIIFVRSERDMFEDKWLK